MLGHGGRAGGEITNICTAAPPQQKTPSSPKALLERALCGLRQPRAEARHVDRDTNSASSVGCRWQAAAGIDATRPCR
eukprot:1841483-Prymnesium_polylepis.1